MDGVIRTVMPSIVNMVVLVLIALPLGCCAGWPCPFGAMKYTSEDGKKRLCYIALHFQEIKFVRSYLWNEAPQTDYYNYDGRNRVESYPDAVRLCAMVPFIRNLSNQGWMTYFKPEWRRIPDYFDLRLPTPDDPHHMEWLSLNLLITPYYGRGTKIYSDYGKMWLGIKKYNSKLEWKPSDRVFHLTRQSLQGDCGYFFRVPIFRSPHYDFLSTGLYWLRCSDEEIGESKRNKKNEVDVVARILNNDVVGCEFDAPDCMQERIANVCAFSVPRNACLEVDMYTTVKQVHPLFGEPCRLNGTFTSEPCPPEHTGQCRTDCMWAEWQNIGPCYVMINERRYVCDEDDEYGVMDRWRKLLVQPKYGGSCQGKSLSTITCVCGAERALPIATGLGTAVLIAHWLRSAGSMSNCNRVQN